LRTEGERSASENGNRTLGVRSEMALCLRLKTLPSHVSRLNNVHNERSVTQPPLTR
jgi:hypothetical protein